MPQPYLKPALEIQINRRVYNFGPRQDNWINGGAADAGVTATTDGDILSLSGTTATNGYTLTFTAYSTSTAQYVTVRAKGSGTLDLKVTYSDATSSTFTITLTANYAASTFTLPLAKTVSSYKFLNQSVVGTNSLDYVVGSGNTPLSFLKEDIDPIQVIRATSSVDDLSFNLRNTGGLHTQGAGLITLYDDIYCYLGYTSDDTQARKMSKVFGGSIEGLSPALSSGGDILRVHALGWSRQLLTVLVAKDYGSLSDNPTITTASGAIKDVIDISNAGAFGGGAYQLTKSYIQTFTPTLSYILLKNDIAFNGIKQLSDLITANNDPTGSTTSPVEFWVDPAENAHLAPLGAWGSDPNPSSYPNTLNVGSEHINNDFRTDIEHLRNQVHYFSATRKPPNGDAWTETDPIGNWTVAATGGVGGVFTTSYDSSANNFKVNNQSVKGNWTGMVSGTNGIDLTYNPAPALAMDVTKLGGKLTPPRLKCYIKTDAVSGSAPYALNLRMKTDATNYFSSNYWPTNVLITTNQGGIPSANWQVFEMPIGPYGDYPPGFQTGSPSWTNINQITLSFLFFGTFAAGNVWVDGFNIIGQTHWLARDSNKVSGYGLRETHLVNDKVRDTATQQLLAKSELFRLRKPVLRGSIRVPGIPDLLPGQIVTVTAPSANLSSKPLRVLEVRHTLGSSEGFFTELDLTDDLTSYTALEPTRLSNLLLEIHVPPHKRREEHDVYMGAPDPTTVVTAINYPS